MATGVTAIIYDDASFEEFVWKATDLTGYHRVAEAGLANHVFKTGGFHLKNMARAQKYLDELGSLTEKEKALRAESAYQNTISFYVEIDDSREDKLAKLKAMLEKVNAWEPPTEDHETFKDLMISQIEETIDFDCSSTYNAPEKKEKPSMQQWYVGQLNVASSSLQNTIERYGREVEQTNKANAWLDALRASVPPPK